MKHPTVILSVLTILLFGVLFAIADNVCAAVDMGTDPALIDRPGPNVVLMGVFYPVSGSPKKGEILLLIRNKQWAFEVLHFGQIGLEKSRQLPQIVLLLSPLRLTGPAGLIKPLADKDLTGKTFEFMGNIYKIDGVMRLRAAMETSPAR